MPDTIIRVENLGKKYVIPHGGAKRSDTFRDALMNGVRSAGRRLRHPLTPSANGSSREEFWALKDVSFEVKRGDVVGIIGRNGAGKSTLLKILSRITEPTTGRVTIYGRVASLLEVGTGFHSELSGRENIYLNGAILGMSRAEIGRKFDEIVAFAEVEKFLDTAVKHYSSGMYMRLAFAVAAHLEPEILIIDEVLAVGDAAFQKKCLSKMSEISEKGRTVLFVSHNMAAITQLCSRAIWVEEAKVRSDSGSDLVIKAYLKSANTHTAERVWSYPGTAPGDERVRLISCRICQDGTTSPIIDINKPARIEITFRILRQCENLVSGISLYDGTGTCLFASCDWRQNYLDPGLYHIATRISAQTLAEGDFSVLIQLVFYEPDIRSVVCPNSLYFTTVDSDHPLSVRGKYKGPWPGSMRLALQWSDASPLVRSI